MGDRSRMWRWVGDGGTVSAVYAVARDRVEAEDRVREALDGWWPDTESDLEGIEIGDTLSAFLDDDLITFSWDQLPGDVCGMIGLSVNSPVEDEHALVEVTDTAERWAAVFARRERKPGTDWPATLLVLSA